jgi:chromosome segregation ATPase
MSEIERLQADIERISEAWRQVILREQRSANAHDYDIRQVEAERDQAVAALVRETARADQNTKAALDYAAQMERLQALPARVVAAERELAKANADRQRLRDELDRALAILHPDCFPDEDGGSE